MTGAIFFQRQLLLSVLLAVDATCGAAAQEVATYRFDFGNGAVATGALPVRAETLFSVERGFGFHQKNHVEDFQSDSGDPLRGDGCTCDAPFFFSAVLPEGNYRIGVTLGHPERASVTTVKAEMRRLMLENVATSAGERCQREFIVHIRKPDIAGGAGVKLKPRELEQETAMWDDRLTLEFGGLNPSVRAIEIAPAEDVPTLFLLGDSTVCDQPGEPWNSWGQMLPRFFAPRLAVANYANSGESIRSSLGSGRFAKVYGMMRPGDYAMVQFGHNDMKSTESLASAQYRRDLEEFVAETRRRGATPILVTSMERKAGVKQATLREYPYLVHEVAAERGAALIDLNRMSIEFYRALGAQLDRAFVDGTHHNAYGSYELAKCVAQAIRESKLALADFLAEDFAGFDPAMPDSPDDFAVPPSAPRATDAPTGN